MPDRYTYHQIGTMIGANREAVTRAFSRLREAGAVEVHRRLVRTPDLDPLRHAAAAEWRSESGVQGRG